MENSNQEVLASNEENQKAGWNTTVGAARARTLGQSPHQSLKSKIILRIIDSASGLKVL